MKPCFSMFQLIYEIYFPTGGVEVVHHLSNVTCLTLDHEARGGVEEGGGVVVVGAVTGGEDDPMTIVEVVEAHHLPLLLKNGAVLCPRMKELKGEVKWLSTIS